MLAHGPRAPQQRALGTSSRLLLATGSTLATQVVRGDESMIPARPVGSSTGEGMNEAGSRSVLAQQSRWRAPPRRSCALVEADEDLVVERSPARRRRTCSPRAAISSHTPALLEHVLDLRRSRRSAPATLVQRAHDRQRVRQPLRKSGSPNVSVAAPLPVRRRRRADVFLGPARLGCAVDSGGDRAVPAAVHATVAGLPVADQPLLAAPPTGGGARDSGQQLARATKVEAAGAGDDRPIGGRGGRARAANSFTQPRARLVTRRRSRARRAHARPARG